MKKLLVIMLSVSMLISLASCNLLTAQKEEIDETLFDFETQLSPAKEGEQIAVVTTTLGSFKIKFFPQYAPNAVENFITLAKEGYYDNTYVFCVDKERALMAGSPDNQGIEYKSIFNDSKPFDNEYTDAIWHFSGSVSAISTEKDKSDSRFLILGEHDVSEATLTSMRKYGYPEALIQKYIENGGSPTLDHRHTIFAQVFEGIETVNAINKVAVDAETGKPTEDVMILKVEITTYGEEK